MVVMPIPEQVEAVARAISPDVMNADPTDWGMAEEQEQVRLIARNAIAAYEATRPAVATDEELALVFKRAEYEAHYTRMSWDGGPLTEYELQFAIAGIRAVRERLAVPVPENVRKIESLRLSSGSWCVTVYYHDELVALIGYGPTIADAIRDAVGRAEGDDE